MVVMKIKMNIF